MDIQDLIHNFLAGGRDMADFEAKAEEGMRISKSFAPMALDTALDIIISTMQDPMGPQSCGLKFNCAVGRFQDAMPSGNSIARSRRFVESYPNVLRATISFLTRKQSRADHTFMMKCLEECRCDKSDIQACGSVHSSTPCGDARIFLLSKGAPVYCSIVILIDHILLVLTNMTHGKFRQAKKGVTSSREEQHWPQGPDDLLPNGVVDSVEGFNVWAADKECGHFILRLAGTIAHLYPIFGAEITRRGPEFHLGLRRPAQHLTAAMDAYDHRPPWWEPSKDDARFAIPLVYSLHFIGHLYTGGKHTHSAMMVTGGKQILLPVLLRGIGILSHPTMSSLFADEFFEMNYLMSVINARMQDSLFCLERLTDLKNQWFMVLQNAHQGGCYNVTCSSKSNVVHAQKCSNCQLIRYCSAKCQKEAWTDRQYPHKTICPKIKSLREQLGPSAWTRVTTPTVNFTFAGFKSLCTKKKIDTELLKEVGMHIACLQGFQTIYQEKNSS
ncbi:hypothetical protein DFP72DRAFT_152127 [Ephemerocybe angulata]|uniref:MYND-type domain-containing protein n=1 Tax=Ephemerocybe angulata TaxID=980116 RepID=A0A8H6LW87_9AGAR|nr:hypothetical protein DFP72DRAFT_152127 [Tulosesus angulatus]